MPVVKVKELPVYQVLLDEIWKMKFGTPIEADKNLLEHRKAFRQEIAQRFGMYAGEFDSKRFEDVFNGVRNTECHPSDVLETSIPISNYPGIELLEAYCHLYYQLDDPVSPSAFRDSAKAGHQWHRFLQDYQRKHAPNELEQAGTPKDFRVWGINLCSSKQVMVAAGSLFTLVLLIGWLLHQFIQGQSGLLSVLPSQGIDTGQRGYLLSLSISSVIQSLIILALILVYQYDEDLGGAHYVKHLPPGIVKTTLRQFQGGWLAIWISLFFLYLWFAFKWSTESQLLGRIDYETTQGHQQAAEQWKLHYGQVRALSWVVADFLNLVGAILYFYLYFILDTESIATEQDSAEGPARNQFFTSIMKGILLLAFLLWAVAAADRLLQLGDYQGLPTLLYSLFTSIAMAMFFGRLNSHFFNASPVARVIFIPLFYLYAALQAVYAMLDFRNVHISVSIIIMVFVLKIILFFYVSKLINKRKLDGYITQMIHQVALEKRQQRG
jgi:hypothetical protein